MLGSCPLSLFPMLGNPDFIERTIWPTALPSCIGQVLTSW